MLLLRGALGVELRGVPVVLAWAIKSGAIFNLMPPIGLLSIAAYLKGRGIDVDSVKITEGRGERLRDYHVVNVALYPGFLSVTFNLMQRSCFTSCYGYIYFESTRKLSQHKPDNKRYDIIAL